MNTTHNFLSKISIITHIKLHTHKSCLTFIINQIKQMLSYNTYNTDFSSTKCNNYKNPTVYISELNIYLSSVEENVS